jgi:hypothetical protein
MMNWKYVLLSALSVAVVSLTACASASKVADTAMDQGKDAATDAAGEAEAAATEAAEAQADEVEVAAVADKMGAYFTALDGSGDWTKLEPLFNALMHDEVVVVTAKGEVDKAGWQAAVQDLLSKNAKASGYEVSKKEAGAFYYKVTITLGDGTVLEAASKGMVKDAMLVRVEPVDPEVYSKLAGEGAEG